VAIAMHRNLRPPNSNVPTVDVRFKD